MDRNVWFKVTFNKLESRLIFRKPTQSGILSVFDITFRTPEMSNKTSVLNKTAVVKESFKKVTGK
jgi:hypothetical protein